jgi:hypothetical protein
MLAKSVLKCGRTGWKNMLKQMEGYFEGSKL